MAKHNKKRRATVIVFSLTAVAYSVKVLSELSAVSETASLIANLLRSAVYIALFASWGVSVCRRVIQPQVRHYLSAVSALLVFWMAVQPQNITFSKIRIFADIFGISITSLRY